MVGRTTRPWLAGFSLTIAVLALLLCLAVSASATTGGAPTAAGSAPPPGSPSGSPAEGSPSAGALQIVSAKTTPRKSFYYGFRSPSINFTISSTQAQNDLRIDVIDAAGEAIRTFFRNDVEPNVETKIRWDGTTNEGRPAPNGHYSFRISSQAGTPAARTATSSSAEPPSLSFNFFGYAFPVLGPHDFGDAAARFGAARSGHTHEGQDTMAACGTPLVAAHAGTVKFSGFQGRAGNYLVIGNDDVATDYGYMHLRDKALVAEGDHVATGQLVGYVGDTGDADGCHLHFEIWTAPGWYAGGHPIDPLPSLKSWDRHG